MSKTKKISTLLFVFCALGVIVFFQNCSGNNGNYSSGSTVTTAGFATNTSDPVFFMSSDPSGTSVLATDVLVTQAFYSHIRNATSDTYICQYVMKNPDGTSNATDPCKSSTPSSSPTVWIALPDDTATDNNPTMRTYYNPPNTLHVTGVLNYLYRNGVKYGPWLQNMINR